MMWGYGKTCSLLHCKWECKRCKLPWKGIWSFLWIYPLTSCLENSTAEEPGRLQSMGLLGVGHDWGTSLSLFTFMHWRRKWQPTPVFLPGESQDGGAWWAAVYGVAQSRTRLKWLSSSSSSSLIVILIKESHEFAFLGLKILEMNFLVYSHIKEIFFIIISIP